MAVLKSEQIVEQVCKLIGISHEKLITLTVHLAVGEPVVIETSFYGETDQVNHAQGVVEAHD